MYIEASRLRYTSNYKKVLLVTGESESWAEYLAATLAKRFGDKIQISTVFLLKRVITMLMLTLLFQQYLLT